MNTRIERRLRQIQKIAQRFIEETGAQGGGCVYYATLASLMLDAPIVAGSVSWQFQPDDGVSATHYSYLFDTPNIGNGQQTIQHFRLGENNILPEMHVWNSFAGKVLDLSTIELPTLLRLALGEEFQKGFMPPEIYHGPYSHKERILYKPDQRATALARFAADIIKQEFSINAVREEL